MSIKTNLSYTKEHEWVRVDGVRATIGITDYAQRTLGDIVYCELPKMGHVVQQFQPFGVVESVKAVSDLYAPVSGKVVAVNQTAIEDPALLNRDPEDAGWLLVVEMSDVAQLKALLNAQQYQALTTEPS